MTKSQVAFQRREAFALVWRPGQYVSSGVPAVLSISLPYEITSDRVKEIAHPAPTVWMHHLELRDVSEGDGQVCGWLANADESARRLDRLAVERWSGAPRRQGARHGGNRS